MIPDGLSARLHFSHWKIPPLFRAIQHLGDIADQEMFGTFNMGIGYVLVVPGGRALRPLSLLAEAGEEVDASLGGDGPRLGRGSTLGGLL